MNPLEPNELHFNVRYPQEYAGRTMAEREMEDTFSYDRFEEFEPQECAICSEFVPELYEDAEGWNVCPECLKKQAHAGIM